MDGENRLADQFEAHRPRLRALGYRMLGSVADADDAVQDAWIALSRGDPGQITNLGGWLTTTVSRQCLKILRERRSRREQPLSWHLPDPVISGPEQQALRADTVSLALMVVLDALSPAERLAFVLHDLFAVPFSEIAAVSGRTPAATRQHASRARRKVARDVPASSAGGEGHREIVDAFFAAARDGDLDALVAILDPDVVVRSDGGTARPALSLTVRGAREVAGQAVTFSRLAAALRPVLVNGEVGVVAAPGGRPFSVLAFTIGGGKITAIHILADPERLDLALCRPGAYAL